MLRIAPLRLALSSFAPPEVRVDEDRLAEVRSSEVRLGGVRLDLGSEAAVRRAFDSMLATLGPSVTGELAVQRMAGRGVPCTVQSVEDPLFGPVVSFEIGGVVTELVEDRAFRIPPLSRTDASELVRSPRTAALRAGPAAHLDSAPALA